MHIVYIVQDQYLCQSKEKQIKNIQMQLFEYSSVELYCGSAQMTPLNRAQKYLSNGI